MLFFFDNCIRRICVCFRTRTRAMYSSADTGAYPEVFHVLFSLASWLHPGEKKKKSSGGNTMWPTGSYICIKQPSSRVPLFWEFFVLEKSRQGSEIDLCHQQKPNTHRNILQTANSSKGLGMEVTNADVPKSHISLPLPPAPENEVWMLCWGLLPGRAG